MKKSGAFQFELRRTIIMFTSYRLKERLKFCFEVGKFHQTHTAVF